MDSERRFIQDLLRLAPGFTPGYEMHLKEYGELLPHVLMGDFTRWFIDTYRRGSGWSDLSEDVSPLGPEPLLQLLDHRFTEGDQEVRDLIGASFLENLWQAEESYPAIKQLLARHAPNLLEQLVRLE